MPLAVAETILRYNKAFLAASQCDRGRYDDRPIYLDHGLFQHSDRGCSITGGLHWLAAAKI